MNLEQYCKKHNHPLVYVKLIDLNSINASAEYKQHLMPYIGKLYVFLGEVKQCPGHGILLDLGSKEIIGLVHMSDFEIASDADV